MVYRPQGQSRWTDTPARPGPQEGEVIRSRGCCWEGYPGKGPRPQAPGSDDARGKLPVVPSYLLTISCQGPHRSTPEEEEEGSASLSACRQRCGDKGRPSSEPRVSSLCQQSPVTLVPVLTDESAQVTCAARVNEVKRCSSQGLCED